MDRILKALACLAVIAVAAGPARAAVITGFDIPQGPSGLTGIAAIAGASSEVSTTPLTRTSNLGGTAFGNHLYFSNWDAVVNPLKYYSTTLTADPGKILNLTDLTYSVEDTGHLTNAFSTFHVRTSLDGFASDIDAFALANNSGLVVNRTTDLTGLGSITGPIEFRFYATTASSGTLMGFANHLPGGAGEGLPDAGQNIRFNGTVSAVPEPTSIALLGIGAVGIIGAARRRRREKQPA